MVPSTNNQQVQIKQAWFALQIYVAFLALVLLAGAGRVLVPLFPLTSILLAAFLVLKTPHLYVGFTLWLTCLGPLIRRIIDFQSGYLTFGPWTMTPSFVACVSLLSLIRILPDIIKRNNNPFFLPLLGLSFSICVGLISTPVRGVVVSCLDWVAPVLFGLYLYVSWREYPDLKTSFEKNFLGIVLVLGVYGLFQFLTLPGWDSFYLKNTEASSFGSPEPLSVRVFSTMNSPQAFAGTMSTGLLLALNQPGIVRFIATPAGYLTFFLSAARTAWLGFSVGLLALIPTSKASVQMRLFSSILVLLIMVIPLINLEPFSETISDRFESFSDIQDDTSLNDRSEGYSELFGLAMTQVFGSGIGGGFSHGSIGAKDSGFLLLFFVLGWIGLIPYVSGLLLLIFQAFTVPSSYVDAFIGSARVIAISILSTIGLNAAFIGPTGIWLWSFLALCIAGYKYKLYQRKTLRETSERNLTDLSALSPFVSHPIRDHYH